MNINWYPGHMAKATRELKESMAFVDTVVDILDARIPLSSSNPKLSEIAGHRPVIMLLNKHDLADSNQTKKWEDYYRSLGFLCTSINSGKGEGIARARELIMLSSKDKLEREKLRGRLIRPVRVMVVGMPNVGKSSFINRLTGSAAAPVGDRPGITRGRKWIRIGQGIELMDTPGILIPKISNHLTGLKLAWTNAIRDEILDTEELAAELLKFIWRRYPQNIINRYGINPSLLDLDNNCKHKVEDVEDVENAENIENAEDAEDISDNCETESNSKIGNILLSACAKARGCLLSGGKIDTNRISVLVLDEFRSGKLGRITLDART